MGWGATALQGMIHSPLTKNLEVKNMADQEEQTEYTQTSSQEQIAPLAQIEQLKMPIEAHGKQFNPIEHEAVAYDETSNDLEEIVTAEFQRGYKLHDQVLRPALVKIARTSQFEAADNTSTEQTQTSNM